MKFSAEQNELCDLIQRFFAEKITSEYLRSRVAAESPSDAALQQELDALGVYEGFTCEPPAFSVRELGVVAEACGRFLVPEPLVEQLIAGGVAFHVLGATDRKVLETVSTGGGRGTIAYPGCCALSYDPQSARISGTISWALGIRSAAWLLGFVSTTNEIRVCAFRLDQPGVTISKRSALDLTTTLHSIELDGVAGVILDQSSSVGIEDLLEAIKASEVAGLCTRVIEMTVEYVKTRKQFGVPVGSFQAIQHLLANCYAKSEALTSLARFATWSAVHSPNQRHLTARAAVTEATQIGPAICEAAIQAHGGIGFTWEYDLHLYLRRAQAIRSAFSLSEVRARALIEAVAAS